MQLDSNRQRSERSQQNQCAIVRSATHFHDILSDSIDEINEVFSMEVCRHFSFLFFRADTINHHGSFLPIQMAPVFLIALMTEVFIVYFSIQSFTLHLGIDWISMFETLIWILYLVLPTLGAIYAGAITSEEVSAVNLSSYFMFTQFSVNY